MDYYLHELMGLPIGSGVTEAACKSVVKERLCGSGMKWSSRGAGEVIAATRAGQEQGALGRVLGEGGALRLLEDHSPEEELMLGLTLIYYQIYDRLHPRNDTPPLLLTTKILVIRGNPGQGRIDWE